MNSLSGDFVGLDTFTELIRLQDQKVPNASAAYQTISYSISSPLKTLQQILARTQACTFGKDISKRSF
jgi:hypothetical protein